MPTNNNTRGYLIGKMSSGRFILTLVAGAGFLYCIITHTMTSEIATIITMVFTLYFTRQRSGEKE